jgi:hypothetical protein
MRRSPSSPRRDVLDGDQPPPHLLLLQTIGSGAAGVPDERTEDGCPQHTGRPLENETISLTQTQPEEPLCEALARVQEVVVGMKDGELQESIEAAIEAIDCAREMPGVAENDQLGPVADALEGALDELEKGKVANLLPLVEQAQSIVQSGSLDGA